MKVNKTVFIKQHVWYLSIIKIKGENCAFWSSHKRTGMTNKDAAKAFDNAHFKEVTFLINQKLQNEFIPEAGKSLLQLQN